MLRIRGVSWGMSVKCDGRVSGEGRGGGGGGVLKRGLSETWKWVRRWDEKLGRQEERLWPWFWERREERFGGGLLDAVEEKGRECLEVAKVWC